MLTFLAPSDIKSPQVCNLIPDKLEYKDRILGSVNSFLGEIINPEGNWFDDAPDAELQRNRYGDVYGCVSFSFNNINEILHRRQLGENINRSDRFLVVGSGTIPNQGNSKKTVANWNRKNGFVSEEKYPYSKEMTIGEYYKKPIPASVVKEALTKVPLYDSTYEFLPDNNQSWIAEGLRYSPLWVDVEQYRYNDKGYIINSGSGYYHEVALLGRIDDYYVVQDSENMQLIKFDLSYRFGTPAVLSLKKKYMAKLYQQKGSPAIYFLNPADNRLVAFSDGVITGGEMFKIFFGDYKNVAIERVDTLPLPIANYTLKTL
jgi:hypothetical protein